MNRDETVIDAQCPVCGDVELGPDQLWLVVTDIPERSHYGFHCPTCELQLTYHAGDAVVDILAPLVATETLAVPAEVLEPRGGPALTVDDLLDLHLALADGSFAADSLADASLPTDSLPTDSLPKDVVGAL